MLLLKRNPKLFEPQSGIKRLVVHPGAGWKHLGGPVWEHLNGTRVHLLGMVRLPDMSFLSANKWPASSEAKLFIRINGGNRKRGLMAWALAHNSIVGGRYYVGR